MLLLITIVGVVFGITKVNAESYQGTIREGAWIPGYWISKKNGMSLQVGKATVFTKESLLKIQDTMREKCINEFNEMYEGNYTLKLKQEGRNKDINSIILLMNQKEQEQR